MQAHLRSVEAPTQPIVLNPADASVWTTYGMELANQGRFAEAEAALHRALELEPSNVQAVAYLGAVLHHDGRQDAASALFDFDLLTVTRLADICTIATEVELRCALLGMSRFLPAGDIASEEISIDSRPDGLLKSCLGRFVAAAIGCEEAEENALELRTRLIRQWRSEGPRTGRRGVMRGIYFLAIPDADTSLRLYKQLPWLPCRLSGADRESFAIASGEVALFPAHFWSEVASCRGSRKTPMYVEFDVINLPR